MRVIAGTARRLLLKTIPGDETRPTTDKIKETLFNMINFDLPGARFLDLYAGSGAIGIEALSRGAVKAVFVENSTKAAACIRDNLEHTHFTQEGELIVADALAALTRLEHTMKEPFDIIFMDPPYDRGLEQSALRYLGSSRHENEDTLFIVEMSGKADIDIFDSLGYEIIKVKEYKSNKHVFMKLTSRGGGICL